jgi:hypothetical protein
VESGRIALIKVDNILREQISVINLKLLLDSCNKEEAKVVKQ